MTGSMATSEGGFKSKVDSSELVGSIKKNVIFKSAHHLQSMYGEINVLD